MNQVRPGIEARRTPRRSFEHPIGVLCQGEFKVVQALQLSEGGLLFLSGKKYKAKDSIVITLLMPGEGSVVARGEVIYERNNKDGGWQYGVKFTSLQFLQRRLIRNYIAAKTEAEANEDLGDLGNYKLVS